MTYTFKLSRRLAQLKDATVIGGFLFLLSCTGAETTEPSPADPRSIAIFPDSGAIGVDETVQFGISTEMTGEMSLERRRRSRIVSVVLSPASSTLVPQELQSFGATTTLSDGSVAESQVIWTATGGTIDALGKYTAGKTPGKYRVMATARNGVADTAVVTIIAIVQLIVTPATVAMQTERSQQLTAIAGMSDGSTDSVAVIWSASGGTISPTGLYTAGPTAGSYRAIAVLAGGTLADTSAISVAAPTPIPPAPPTSPPPGVPILPGQSIQAAVTANVAGTTFLIKTGKHIRQSVVPKKGNTFRCEPGAILDGESVTPHAFRRSGSDPDDVRIVGCLIERYAPPAQMGAILAGGHTAGEGTSGWIVDSTEVRNNSNLGIRLGHRMKVRWSYVHHNSRLGIGGIGDDILIEGTEIAYNNPSGAGLGFEAGGSKFVLTKRLSVRNNFVHHNLGNGLWADIDNDGALFEGNRVEDNLRAGISMEISYSAIIRNNTVRRNGSGRTSWMWGPGISIAASGGGGIEIYGNLLEGNTNGIALIQQNRACGVGGGNCLLGPYLVQNVHVHDNTVIMATGATGAVTDTGDNSIFTSRNNRFTNNKYVITGNARPFAWMNAYRTEAEWKSYGQDATGAFTR